MRLLWHSHDVINSDFPAHLTHTDTRICIASASERGSEKEGGERQIVECGGLIPACHSQLAAWLKIRIAIGQKEEAVAASEGEAGAVEAWGGPGGGVGEAAAGGGRKHS